MLIVSELKCNGHHSSSCEAAGDVNVLLTESHDLDSEGAIGVPRIETLCSAHVLLQHHTDPPPVHLNEA